MYVTLYKLAAFGSVMGVNLSPIAQRGQPRLWRNGPLMDPSASAFWHVGHGYSAGLCSESDEICNECVCLYCVGIVNVIQVYI